MNIESSGIESTYRISYLLYPIPNPSSPTGTKFAYSGLIAKYIEATKTVRPGADFELIAKLFSIRPDGTDWQTYLRIGATEEDVRRTMREFLVELHIDATRVEGLTKTYQISESLAAQRKIVEESVHTIKIPTLLIDGRRYDRVISPEKLRSLLPQ